MGKSLWKARNASGNLELIPGTGRAGNVQLQGELGADS